jgi:hypothetical protein
VACALKLVGGSDGQYLSVLKFSWAWLALHMRKNAPIHRKVRPLNWVVPKIVFNRAAKRDLFREKLPGSRTGLCW